MELNFHTFLLHTFLTTAGKEQFHLLKAIFSIEGKKVPIGSFVHTVTVCSAGVNTITLSTTKVLN